MYEGYDEFFGEENKVVLKANKMSAVLFVFFFFAFVIGIIVFAISCQNNEYEKEVEENGFVVTSWDYYSYKSGDNTKYVKLPSNYQEVAYEKLDVFIHENEEYLGTQTYLEEVKVDEDGVIYLVFENRNSKEHEVLFTIAFRGMDDVELYEGDVSRGYKLKYPNEIF